MSPDRCAIDPTTVGSHYLPGNGCPTIELDDNESACDEWAHGPPIPVSYRYPLPLANTREEQGELTTAVGVGSIDGQHTLHARLCSGNEDPLDWSAGFPVSDNARDFEV